MDAIALPGDRPRALSAFASRDFRLLWGGQTVSFLGDAAFLVALGWRVTSMTGSAGTLAFVLALMTAAMLTTLLWGGVLADNTPALRLYHKAGFQEIGPFHTPDHLEALDMLLTLP